jgi:hypothetical protein
MQMLQGQDNLANIDPDFVLGKLFPLVQVGEEFSAIYVI